MGLKLSFLVCLIVISIIVNACSNKEDSCKGLKNESLCYALLAIEKKDILTCNKVKDKEKQSVCFQRTLGVYFHEMGGVSGPPAQELTVPICDKIENQDWRDVCYFKLAQSNKDMLICNKMSTEEEWSECYSETGYNIGGNQIKVTVGLCDKLKDGWGKDNCYSDAADNDKSACQKIKDEVTKEGCLVE